LSFVSPWPNSSLSPTFIAAVALFWVMVTQIASYLVGGYIAGRMRSRWAEASPHEVEFRDGIHGVLVWALGVVISALLLLATAASAIKGGAEIATRVATTPTTTSATSQAPNPLDYYADVLLRPRAAGAGAGAAAAPAGTGESHAEVVRVLQRSVVAGRLSDTDRGYLAQIVSQLAGLPAPEAQKRVDDTFSEANRVSREAADKARRGSILTGLITAVSLLIALAAAWWAAQQGGQHRDKAVNATLFRRTTVIRMS
jgi:MFS family permease